MNVLGFTLIEVAVGFVFLAGISLSAILMYWSAQINRNVDEEFMTNGGELPAIQPPNVKNERFGLAKAIRERRKKERLLNRGYVQWFLIDDSFPRAKFVKPEQNEGGIPEVEHKGTTYLFPLHSRLPNEEQGIWTYVHRKGEADPVNLKDPNELAIPADVLSEYLTLRVTSSAPGWMGGLPGFGDMDSMDMLRYAVLGMIGLFILMEFTAGGIF